MSISKKQSFLPVYAFAGLMYTEQGLTVITFQQRSKFCYLKQGTCK